MMFTDSVIMFDNVRQSLTLIVNVAVNDFASPREGYEHAQRKIDELIDGLPARSSRPGWREARSLSTRRLR